MSSPIRWIGLSLLAIALGLALAYGYTLAVARGPFSFSPVSCPFTWSRGVGGPGMGPGMMYRYGQDGIPTGKAVVSLDDAVKIAEEYVTAQGNPDLVLVEVMEFSNHFYAEVAERSTGIHAFEILIDRYSGSVSPEPGPNMMWNTKYGHMGGMMGGWRGWRDGATSIGTDQALKLAQQWLDRYMPGMTVEEADTFYGYYTIHVMKGDQIYGMLSVNDYTGQVWYHTWHGEFINMVELEE